MKTSDFTFELPENLIAQYPEAERGRSRLLVIDRETRRLEHRLVASLPELLPRGTVMVFNNSRVRRARLLGVSEASGAKAEFLLLNKLDAFSWQVIAKRSKRMKSGNIYKFDGVNGEIVSVYDYYSSAPLRLPSVQCWRNNDGMLILRFDRPIDDAWLDIHGHIPLPPYIKRDDSEFDFERYQTVYAGEHGSVAAPTAGLHFTEELLAELKRAGIETVFITLHVGLGTFLPVRTENVEDHKMHEETYSVSDEAASSIERARAEGRKVVAAGTTSLRTLESAWENGRLRRKNGSTSIFIYPGYTFKAVDALFTNFHTPGSTLLMLVSAFAGRDFILESYMEAVKAGYRFFSYGDACLIK